MFTGIIQDIGRVVSLDKNGGWRLGIETQMNLSETQTGASIACSGCCLTVIQKDKNIFYVEVSQETLSRTSIKNWQEGSRINLEPALKAGDELGGHFVSGHIDGQAVVEALESAGESRCIKFKAPPELTHYLAPKGSVTLDGVSLTVNGINDNDFLVNIIPHTWTHTTFQYLEPGMSVNLEIDMLARYIARLMETSKERQ